MVSTSDGDAATIDMPVLFADYDPSQQSVLGQASPGVEISFRLLPPPTGDRPQPPIDIGRGTTDQNGAVTVPWPTNASFVPGAKGFATIRTTGGHTVETQFAPFSCQPVVGSATVYGQASFGSDISVELTKPSGLTVQKWITASAVSTSYSNPAWQIDLGDSDWRIEPGSLITVTQGFGSLLALQQISRVVPSLTLVVDLPGKEVRGSAPPGGTVVISADLAFNLRMGIAPRYSTTTQAPPSGGYRVPVSSSQVERGWNVLATLKDSSLLQFQAEQALRLFRVYEYGNAMVSYIGIAARPVTVTVMNSEGTLKFAGGFTTNRNGHLDFSMGNSLDLPDGPRFEPGDRIEINFSEGDPILITVPKTTSRYDVETEAVYGVAPAGAVLRVTRGDANNTLSTMGKADADGNYRVDVSGLAPGPVSPFSGTHGYVILESNSGAEFYLPWSAVTLLINLGTGGILGDGPAGRKVHIGVRDAQKGLITEASTIAEFIAIDDPATQWQSILYDRIGRPLDLRPGQRMHLDVGDDQLDLNIPELSGAYSLKNNSIFGHAPPGMPISIYIYHRYAGLSTTKIARTNQAGLFSISASPEWTIRPGDYFDLSFITSEGHRLSRRFVSPYVEVDLDKSSVTGFLTPQSHGLVVLGRLLQPLEWRDARTDDYDGSYTVDFAHSQGLLTSIPARSQLRVISGTLSGDVVVSTRVPTLTVEVDRMEKTIHGFAPSDGSLRLQVTQRTPRFDQDDHGSSGTALVPLEANGTYSIPFAALSVGASLPGITMPTGIRAVSGQSYFAYFSSSDNNLFTVSKTIPLLDVPLGGALVCAIADPRMAVSLELHAMNGDLLGGATGMTTVDGLASLVLRDKEGRLLRTQPGQRLVAHVGAETTERVIPDSGFAVTWDVPRAGGWLMTQFSGHGLPPLWRSYFSIGTGACEAMLSDKQHELVQSLSTDSTDKGEIIMRLPAARPGQFAQASFYGESDDLFSYRDRRLQASVLLDTGRIEGAASPVSDVVITLTRQSLSQPITGHSATDEAGKFSTTLRDENGSEFSIRPGDVLLMASENQTATVGVERLDFDFSDTSGLMVNLPENRTLHIKLTLADGREYSFDVISDADGRVTFGPRDLPTDAGWTLVDVARIALSIDTPSGHVMRAEGTRGEVRAPTPTRGPEWTQVFIPRVQSARR